MSPTKIAISSRGDNWDDPVDERFGRAAYFAIVDTRVVPPALVPVPNKQNLQAAQGAGIQAAQNVADQGVTVLLTGHVGPKAFTALNAAGIEIFTGISGTVKDALSAYLSGSLTKASGADVEGHW